MWSNDIPRVDIKNKNWYTISNLSNKEFYNLVVTPVIIKDKGTKFTYYSAFSVLKTATDEEIEILMRGSDMYVNPEAKNAAIYSYEDMYGLDVYTCERIVNEERVLS